MSKLVVPAATLSLLCGAAWKGVIVLGPSAMDRRDLAQGAVGAGCIVISDDHTTLWSSGGYLYAGPTGEALSSRDMTRVWLAVLTQSEGPPAADDEVTPILGHRLPTLRLNPRHPSAVTRLITRLRQA